MDCLMLRLDAPLMSFGGVVIDQRNPTDRFPGRSLLTGLFANALGWMHSDQDRLDALQSSLLHAARWDTEPERVDDYQTVDLGQHFMQDTGWTTRGRREDRGKGDATSGTHQRYRHYWANGCVTVAATLVSAAPVSLDALEDALRAPARPLFIGRKPCLPAAPILLGRRQAESLRIALMAEPAADVGIRTAPQRMQACWPASEGGGAEEIEVFDLRDWRNNLHTGTQRYALGFLEVNP
jgi:CRISPR system Cascade subunit CasD